MSNKFCICNVCQSEIWPWSSQSETAEEENSLQNIAMYRWTDNSNTEIPPDDPYQFEKNIQDEKSPEKRVERLSKALYHQIERTNYIQRTCQQLQNDQVMSNKIRDNMRDRILGLEKQNDVLCKLLENKNSQHLEIINPQKTNLASTNINKRNKENSLYRECIREIYR